MTADIMGLLNINLVNKFTKKDDETKTDDIIIDDIVEEE